MSAYLRREPIFGLEGPDGYAELWADQLGYVLFYENEDSYKIYPIRKYACREGGIDDAFEDAKDIVGLSGWPVTWQNHMKEMRLNHE